MHVSNSKLFVNVYYRNKKVLSVGSLSFFQGMQLVLAAYVNCAFVAVVAFVKPSEKKTLKGSKQQCQQPFFFFFFTASLKESAFTLIEMIKRFATRFG